MAIDESINPKTSRYSVTVNEIPGIVLPMNCALGQDEDGDWWIIPPADVLIYSEPGEMALLGSYTSIADAISEAEDYLANVCTQ